MCACEFKYWVIALFKCLCAEKCAGKTTLLRIMAGKHMVGGRDVVQVLSRSAFHDTQLVCGGDLAYLGGSWSKTVGSAVSF